MLNAVINRVAEGNTIKYVSKAKLSFVTLNTATRISPASAAHDSVRSTSEAYVVTAKLKQN